MQTQKRFTFLSDDQLLGELKTFAKRNKTCASVIIRLAVLEFMAKKNGVDLR